MAVLAVLAEAPTSQTDIGRRLDLDPSDVTATVDDLESRTLVARSPDPIDRRRKVVTLTAKGHREITDLDRMARRLADELLEPVPERRRRQLHEDLLRVLRTWDAQSSSAQIAK